jgi:hypothetical protein
VNQLIIFNIANNILFSTVEKHVSIFVLFIQRNIPLINGWCLLHGGPLGSDQPCRQQCQTFPKKFSKPRNSNTVNACGYYIKLMSYEKDYLPCSNSVVNSY